ncbi:MAG: hypothetical protein JGK24_03675 [Microcoleus sp. PH2017_29_MFU_D_A]|uniref:NACHT domain-containing protein n=1 Tax=unclassified Microcoleus TaxID=2642155 RepID=UPI001DB41250|nr:MULTISPECIES: hypothetical protein [unclassified Microcoleus]MCC3418346.1 hypothetical protein [Microcoleus sp. PH2017_07_MST_O_A]TAG68720.1 MAG: hypothetical protein EAZ25_02300 [Oscillatoriales cyanobacterium]MCC3422977.1 hypothetical protein [Microcoleus sp. PH2017_01_SCD_O_A]MCC3453881.1 hypothetical protein [Microcoleus sp. PH2017_08_TRC_O_A]MCC3602347.1 hypothetical protein [Microcoleus sp. PH2017_29_MFU_D_A]
MVANLKTSEQGIAKNKQARNEKGWRVDDPRWLVEASKILEPKKIWQEGGPYADGCSEGNWKRFLYGTGAVNTEVFKALCRVLGVSWEEIVDRAVVAQDFAVEQSPDKSQEVGRRTLLVEQIDLLNRESSVRCAGLWQVIRVNDKEADELANDQSLGAPPANLQLDPGRLILLIGEMGAGKSLMAERLFQRAIQQLREDINAPIPIYIEAWQLQAQKLHEKVIEASTSSMGNPQTQGAVVIIDRTDEVERSLASRILREARIIVKGCQKTTIIITSRPIPDFAEAEESVIVPPLSNEQAYTLINRLAGKTVTSIVQNSAESVLNAINRPLFAVLIGIYLRNQNGRLPRSKEHLLSSLVEHSLRLVKLPEKRIVQMLQQLAIFSVDGGGAPVPANKVASWFERQELLNSVLVIEHSEHLRFSLPILTQWFAKESLAIGKPDPNELASEIERIERWRYPLILATATLDSEQVSRFLEVIAERYPAIAAEIVNEALVDGNITNETSLPQSLELGRQVRTAMQAWINGIASIAQLIAGVREDGTLRPIGVRVSKKRLDIDLPIDFDIFESKIEIARYIGNDFRADVFKLNLDFTNPEDFLKNGFDWYRSPTLQQQSCWHWKWTQQTLVESLSVLLREFRLPIDRGILVYEGAWVAALLITKRYSNCSLHYSPIPLAEIEQCLDKFDRVFRDEILGIGIDKHHFDLLVMEIDCLHIKGKEELRSPWFSITELSHEQILAQAIEIYTQSIETYQKIVKQWFPKFSDSLQTMALLPAQIAGVVIPPSLNRSQASVSWYWKPLPAGSLSTVDFVLSDRSISEEENCLSLAFKQLYYQRPQVLERSGKRMTVHTIDPTISCLRPVTELVYNWLWNDLKRIFWVKGELKSSNF